MKERKGKFITIATIALVLIAAITISFPFVQRAVSQNSANAAIAEYDNTIDKMSDKELREANSNADKYNKTGGTNYYTAVSQEGLIGYIEIPVIDVYLPIYDNTDDSTLEMGVGHLETTSLPTGEAGTHCVITGHSGLTEAKMFSDLTQLDESDTFYIHFLGQKQTYQIYDIETVEPSDAYEKIEIQTASNQDESLCTLLTCTPIGVNTHRLLVHGKLVETTEDTDSEETANTAAIEATADETVTTTPQTTEKKTTLIDPQTDKALMMCVPIGIAILVGAIITRVGIGIHRKKKDKS